MKNKNYYKRYDNTIVYFVWDKHVQRYFKGTSVCKPEDTFNLETGIKIAKTKALIKLRSFYVELMDEQLDIIKQLKEQENELKQQKDYWLTKTEESHNILYNILTNLEK